MSADTSWIQSLNDADPDVELLRPAAEPLLRDAERAVGVLPRDLRDCLVTSNGLICRGFRVFSAFDPAAPKKTWESLQRANDPQTSAALTDGDLFAKFVVFADINNGYAYIERTDQSIWYRSFAEDDEAGAVQLHRTELSFREFVELTVKNVE